MWVRKINVAVIHEMRWSLSNDTLAHTQSNKLNESKCQFRYDTVSHICMHFSDLFTYIFIWNTIYFSVVVVYLLHSVTRVNWNIGAFIAARGPFGLVRFILIIYVDFVRCIFDTASLSGIEWIYFISANIKSTSLFISLSLSLSLAFCLVVMAPKLASLPLSFSRIYYNHIIINIMININLTS